MSFKQHLARASLSFFLLLYSPVSSTAPAMPTHDSANQNLVQETTVQETIVKKKLYEISEIRGLYLHAWSVKKQKKIEDLVQNMKETGMNTVVLDIKSNAGEVLFKTPGSMAEKIGSEYDALGNLEELVKRFHEQKIYVIARQVVFNDPILIKKKPKLGILDSAKNIWSGEMSNRIVPWADPFSEDVKNYNFEVMENACKAGVDEIQFDYIRFPAKKDLVYTYQKEDIPKVEVLKNFLEQAKQICTKYDVKLGLDIFGFSIINQGDLGVGHSFAELIPYLDVISPMLYPSHYSPGNFGFQKPQDEPFQVISKSMAKAHELVAGKCLVRPWIQSFGWNTPTFSEQYIINEIRGVLAGGSNSFLVWNAESNYEILFKALKNAKPSDFVGNLKPLGLF